MCVCVCMCVCMCVCVCACVCVNGSSPVPDHVVETRRGQGSLALVLQANNKDTSCIHIMHVENNLVYII